MYIGVCADLPLAQQLVQVAHAAQECGIYFSTPQLDSDFMVICTFANEAELLAEAAKHDRLRVIREPDLGGRATAIASPPLVGAERKPFRRWRMWTPSHGGIAHSFAGAPHASAPGEFPGPSAISKGSSEAERRSSNASEVAGSNPAPSTKHLDRRNGKEDFAHLG